MRSRGIFLLRFLSLLACFFFVFHTPQATKGVRFNAVELDGELSLSVSVFAAQFSRVAGKTNVSLEFHTPPEYDVRHGYGGEADPLTLLRQYTPRIGTRVVACNTDCFFSDEFARFLSCLAELEYICFRFNKDRNGEDRVGDAGVVALVRNPMMRNLRTLEIMAGCVTNTGVEVVAASPHMQNLRCLKLGDNVSKWFKKHIGDAGLKALALSPYLRGMRELCLAGGSIGDDGFAALAESPLMDTLEVLDLSSNKITDKGAIAFANGRRPKALTSLMLSNEMVWKERSTVLTISLELYGNSGRAVPVGNMNKIGDMGARAIILSQALPHLQRLNLKDTLVTASLRDCAPVKSQKIEVVF